LVFSKYPQWRDYPDSVRKWLKLTADKVHPWYETVDDSLFYYYDEPIAHPGWNHLMGYGRVNIYDALILDPNAVLNAGYEENNQQHDFYRWEEKDGANEPSIWVETNAGNVHSGLYSVRIYKAERVEVTLTQKVATKPQTTHNVNVFMKPYRLEGGPEDGAVIFVNGESISTPVTGTTEDFIEVEAQFYSGGDGFVYLGVGLTERAQGTVYIDDISVAESGDELAMSQEIYDNRFAHIPTKVSPNPFDREVKIDYILLYASNVTVRVYNSVGQVVRKLQSGVQSKGPHTLRWDGKDDTGSLLPSGIYFYRVSAQNTSVTQKLLLLR
jgi:hypothetical protein